MSKNKIGSQYVVYGKSHYERNRQSYIDKSIERRKKLSEYINDIKKASQCKDCGVSNWIVLDFDHLGNKKFDISQAPKYGWSKAKVDSEIAKCDIVCSNCHRIRTYTRRLQ